MSKTSDYNGEAPAAIFVVVWDDKYRMYVRERQALNWFSKKIAEGYKVKMVRYSQGQLLAG